ISAAIVDHQDLIRHLQRKQSSSQLFHHIAQCRRLVPRENTACDRRSVVGTRCCGHDVRCILVGADPTTQWSIARLNAATTVSCSPGVRPEYRGSAKSDAATRSVTGKSPRL